MIRPLSRKPESSRKPEASGFLFSEIHNILPRGDRNVLSFPRKRESRENNGFPIKTFGNDKCGDTGGFLAAPALTHCHCEEPTLNHIALLSPIVIARSQGLALDDEAISRMERLPRHPAGDRNDNNGFARRLAAALALTILYSLFTKHSLSAAPLELDYMEYTTTAAAQAAYVSNSSVTATGGTITYSGGYTIHTFTSNGTFTVTNGSGNIEVLVVAGGGSGGTNGGGSGAGGLTYNSSYAVTTGAITVTVGAGGTGGLYPTAGTNGGNSVFGLITSTGGGRGGSQGVGQNGGSGGGGGYSDYAGGAGISGQGNNGAAATAGASGNYGGGGGAGVAASGMNGGNGLAYSISGTSIYYAGGGGGGRQSGAPAGSGGLGGGGNGNTLEQAASHAVANTGGGGGGSAGGSGTSGNGGSGIVIVRYAPFIAYSEPTIRTQGSYAIKSSAPVNICLNKTLTRTVSPTINLSNYTQIKFDIRSTRTGSNIKIGIRDSGGTTTYITPNVTSANNYQTVDWDISAVSNANKDAIDRIIIEIVNAAASNTFYIDNLFAPAIVPNASVITSASSNSSDKITWSWQDNSSGNYQEDEFRVYSSTGGLLTTRTADTTFWIETGLKRNKEYSRYIQSYNTAGSSNSATISWRTKPGSYPESVTIRAGSKSFGFVGDGNWTYDIPAKSGQLATVKVWVRYNAEYGAAQKPRATLSNLGVSSSQQMTVGSNTWEELTLSGTPSRDGSLLLKIEGESTAPGARVYADDISVSQ